MTQDDLKLLLEALKWCHGGERCGTAEVIAVGEKALAQTQELVADDFFRMIADRNPKPFSSLQRTWVGLTGEEAMDVTRKEGHELLDFIYEYGLGSEGVEERIVAICKAIEAKLMQKNGYAEEKNT